MRFFIVLALCAASVLAYARVIEPVAVNSASAPGTFQIVPTSHGVYSVFRLNTATGKLSCCYVEGSTTVQGLRCVGERR